MKDLFTLSYLNFINGWKKDLNLQLKRNFYFAVFFVGMHDIICIVSIDISNKVKDISNKVKYLGAK